MVKVEETGLRASVTEIPENRDFSNFAPLRAAAMGTIGREKLHGAVRNLFSNHIARPTQSFPRAFTAIIVVSMPSSKPCLLSVFSSCT
jgi:hypothetical protein